MTDFQLSAADQSRKIAAQKAQTAAYAEYDRLLKLWLKADHNSEEKYALCLVRDAAYAVWLEKTADANRVYDSLPSAYFVRPF